MSFMETHDGILELPDALWKTTNRISFAIIGGKTSHPYLYTMWGFAHLHLENDANIHVWDIGADGMKVDTALLLCLPSYWFCVSVFDRKDKIKKFPQA